MPQEEKQKRIENMVVKYMSINEPERRRFAFMCMTAYEEGKEAGREEERRKLKEEMSQ